MIIQIFCRGTKSHSEYQAAVEAAGSFKLIKQLKDTLIVDAQDMPKDKAELAVAKISAKVDALEKGLWKIEGGNEGELTDSGSVIY